MGDDDDQPTYLRGPGAVREEPARGPERFRAKDSLSKALTVRCPRCGMGVGRLCENNRLPMSERGFHPERFDRYEQAW